MSAENMIEVFVSYSRDSDEHQEWVSRLADALEREKDIHVVLDEYDLYGGKDLLHFMEQCRSCHRAIIVVTPAFVPKANDRTGGVGYETSLGAAELFRDQLSDKFIPVLRAGSELPKFISSKSYVDFRDDSRYGESLLELLRSIRREPSRQRPEKSAGFVSTSTPVDETQSPTGRYDTVMADHLREVLGLIDVPIKALEAFHEDVQVLVRDGVWVFNINIGPRQQITDAEQRFRDQLRLAVDQMGRVEKILRHQIKRDTQGSTLIMLAGSPLLKAQDALTHVIVASKGLSKLLSSIKIGLPIDELRSSAEYQDAARAATSLSEILMDDLNKSPGELLGFYAYAMR